MAEDKEEKENNLLFRLIKTVTEIDWSDKSNKNNDGFEDENGDWVNFNGEDESEEF